MVRGVVHMLRLRGLIGVLLIIVGLSAYNASSLEAAVAEGGTSVKAPVQVKVTPTVKNDGLLLRDQMQVLSFGQYNELCCSSVQIEWKSDEIPSETLEIPFHLEELNISAEYTKFNSMEEKRIKDAIKVNGNVKWEVTPNPDYAEGFIVRFYKPTTAFSVQISDLSEIKFVPRKPIEYKVLDELGDKQSYLFIKGEEYGTRLLIPAENDSITLAFSENMQTTALPIHTDGSSVKAEWLDSKHLRIQLVNVSAGENGNKELEINLDPLRAKSNDNLRIERNKLAVHQMPDIEWRDSKTGAPVGFSPRDRFYQQIVTSPDGQSYIGVIPLGGSMGDGDGISYSFVLERPNQEPVVIEHVFYSKIEPFDLPVQWIDNQRILYSTYVGVYIYDITKGEQITLRDTDHDKRDYINFAVYDHNLKQIYVLVNDNPEKMDQYDLFTYLDGNSTPKQTKNFTKSVQMQLYNMTDMSIVPTKLGTYWTRIENGIPYTEFVNKAGKKFKAEGYIRAVCDAGVYLERFKAGEVLESTGYSYWQPGKKTEAIKIPEYNEIFANGSNLIIKIDSKFLVYNPVTRKWDNWKATGGGKEAVPVKGANGLYYVRKDSIGH